MSAICNFLCSQWSLLLVRVLKMVARLAGYQLTGPGEMVVPKGWATFDRQEAARYGLNAAILLAEMRGWMAYNERAGKQSHFHAGQYWLYNSPAEWRKEHFPWWSEATIRRTLDALVESGLATWREYEPHNARRWWTVGQIDTLALQPAQGILQFDTPVFQPATHTCIESSGIASSMPLNAKPTAARGRVSPRRGAVAVFPGSQAPGHVPDKAAVLEGRERVDREGAPAAGLRVDAVEQTPSPSSAAPLPPLTNGHGSAVSLQAAIPAWMRAFWCGATDGVLHEMLQKHGEGKLLAASARARRTPGISNPPGFALHLLAHGLIRAEDVWTGAPEETDTTPDIVVAVETDEDATDELFSIPEDVRRVWEISAAQMRQQFGHDGSYLDGARPVEGNDKGLVVEVRSRYARDLLQHRMGRDVRSVVRGVAGNAAMGIRFVVKGEQWRETAQEGQAA